MYTLYSVHCTVLLLGAYTTYLCGTPYIAKYETLYTNRDRLLYTVYTIQKSVYLVYTEKKYTATLFKNIQHCTATSVWCFIFGYIWWSIETCSVWLQAV